MKASKDRKRTNLMPDKKSSLTGWSSAVWQYAIAFLSVGAAALIRLQLTPVIGSDVPLLTFFVPVLVMAWYLDFWPSVLATLLSAVAVIFVRPAAFAPGWTGWARVAGFVVVVLAISYLNDKRRAASRAQSRQADMLRIVLEQIPLGILIAEAPSGKVLMSNGRFDHMLARPVALAPNIEAYGEYKGFHLDGKQHTDAENPVVRAIRNGELVEDEEFHTERSDGTHAVLRVRAAPVRDPNGRIVAGVAALVDVTEKKRIEDQLAQNAKLLDIAYDAIIVLSLDGAIEFWNDGAARLYGWTKQEVMGRGLHSLLKTEFPEPLKNIQANLDADGRWEGELTQTTRSGRSVVVSSRWDSRKDLTGKAAGWLEINRDITANKQAEAAIQHMAGIVESSEDAIVSKDLDGSILTWNAAAERMYGYTSGEAIGRSIEILLPPDRLGEERDILERLRRGEGLEHFETKRVRKDNVQIHVSMTISPIRDRTGRITGASHIARDITEQKQFQEQLRHIQKLESLGVLAAGVAHDFNNLLTGILGHASLLAGNMAAGSASAQSAQSIVEASVRAADLISQLLAYAGKGRLVMAAIDCSELVRDISVLISSSIPKKVQLQLTLDGQLPTVIGDASQLQQVIMNLIINGAESIGEAAGTVSVRTSVERIDERYLRYASGMIEPVGAGEYISLEVVDTGCGMDEAMKANIFDPFFTTKFAGRGLGLATVRGIVRRHKGSLEVYSAPGCGSQFKILLPVAGTQVRAAEMEHGPETRDLSGTGMILVVDDEEMVRKIVQVSLERFGYTVVLAEDGQRAIEIVNQLGAQLSVVLLDMTMPVMSGNEALRHIKTIAPWLPVIASSGHPEVEALSRFGSEQLAGFVQKPYTFRQLGEILKDVLTKESLGPPGL